MSEIDFQSYLNGVKQQGAARSAAAVTLGAQEPDAMAEGLNIGRELDVPANVVTAAPEIFRKQLAQKRATTALADAPKTAAWLTNPTNAALARDDLETLGWFERGSTEFAKMGASDDPITSIGRAVGRGLRRLPAIPKEGGARVDSQMVADIGKSADQIYQGIIADYPANTPREILSSARQNAQLRFEAVDGMSDEDRTEILRRGAESLSEARQILDAAGGIKMSSGAANFRDVDLENSPDTLTGVLGAFAENPVGGAAFIAETAAEFLPAMAAAVGVTLVTKSPGLGAITMGAASGLAENANSAMEFLAEQGADVSTPEKAIAILENEDLMQAAADRGLTRGLIIGLMDAVSGGVAGKTLAKSPAGDFVAQALAQIGFGAGGEAAGQLASGQKFSWREVVIEGLAELATAPIEVLGVGGRGFRRLIGRAKTSNASDRLAEIDKRAAASKLKERSPEKFQEALEAQGDETFYIPAAGLRELFQAKDITNESEILGDLGIDPVLFEEQVSSGQDVAISAAVYAAQISGTDDASWFAENAVRNPDEMSTSDAQRFNDEVQGIMDEAYKEAEQARLNDEAVRASDVQIYDETYSQLRAAGRSPDVAQNEARVMTAFWRTMSDRYGEDALDLAKSMGLRIQGPQRVEKRQRGEIDTQLNTLRSGKKEKLGESLLDFVRAQGGVRDAGGDIEAMGAPKGVIGETQQEAQDREQQMTLPGGAVGIKGMGIDELGRLAIEAGFFPEYAGTANTQADGTVVDEAAIMLEAIREAVAGNDRYRLGDGPDTALRDLADELDKRGIDLASASNDEVVAALDDGQSLFQDIPWQPLAVAHNISARGLELADELGGLAGPSLGIVRADIGPLDGFGEITLIGGQDFADPRKSGVKAFNADVYSKRQPRALTAITTAKRRKVEAKLDDAAAELGGNGFNLDVNDFERGGLTHIADQPEAILTFLREKGVPFRVPKTKLPTVPAGLKKIISGTPYDVRQDEKMMAAITAHFEAESDALMERFPDKFPARSDTYFFDGDGSLNVNLFNKLVNNIGLSEKGRKPDYMAARDALRKRVRSTNKLQNEFIGWVDAEFGALTGDQFFENKSGRRIPYNLDNLVRFMRGSVRDQEGFNYGVGNIRSNMAQEFKSISAVKGARDQIVTKKEFEAVKGEVAKEFDALVERIAPSHSSGDQFGFYDTASEFIGDVAKGNAREWQESIFTEPVSSELMADIRSFLNKLKVLPTEYFEVKMQRAVELSEFDQALVPNSASPKTVALLKKHGIKVSRYDGNTNDGRSEAMAKMSPKTFFQSAPPTDSAAFKKWFGDSKVVDADGKPLVVYHGTYADVSDKNFEFELGHDGGFDAELSDGFFFSEPGEMARDYSAGGRDQVSAYLAIESPLDLTTPDGIDTINAAIEADDRDLEGPRGLMFGEPLSSGENIWDHITKGESEAPNDVMNGLIKWADKNGYDGIKFLDAGRGSEGISHVAFEPTQIKSVNNRGTFDPSDPRILYQGQEKPRGSIQFPAGGLKTGETVINLFENADLSTFLHEGAHFFLEAFASLSAPETAPQQMRDDMATIRKWLGNDGGNITTEQHEQWARGSEAYFMEGKAPSLDLAAAFSRFKAWMTRIYKTALGLNVKITPEIRGVMDRMLATDAEIADAMASQEMTPLFTSAPPGMSATDWQTYQRMARRGADTAERKLLDKVMGKVRREKEAWYKKEKASVRKEVESEINKQPVYRLTEMLGNKKWIGSGKDVPDMRINRQDLVDMFGEGIIAELYVARLGGKRAIYAADGSSPGEVAEFFGFDGPVQMVDALRNAGKRKDAIASEVERRMVERHGDPLNDGTIEAEALAAIHNEQQAETTVSEARHIAKQLGRDTRGMKTKIYRERAKLMVGRMSVREASRPAAFLAAERKASRAAQDAFAKVARGDSSALATALQAKEQQILNGFIYNEARKVEAYVQKGRERMRKYSKATIRKNLEGGYIEQIDAILDGYDFRVRSNKDIQRAESLRDFMARMIEDGRESELAIDDRLADAANRKHYTKLTVGELRGLFDTVANLDHIGRFKHKLIEAGRKRDLLKSVGKVSDAIKANFGTGKAKKESRIRSTFNLLWTTDTMLVEMDGGDEMGASYEEIKQSIDDGQNFEQQMSVDLAESLDGIFKVYSGKELRAMQTSKQVDGVNHKAWSKLEILAVALNTGNADNLQRLMADDAHPDFRLTRPQVDALLDTLDKRDWDFVQSMWDLINGYWPQISEVTTRRTGVKPKKVDATPVNTKFGTYAGGYYPIKYDAGLSANANLDDASAFDTFISAGRNGKAQTARGHTKARKRSGNGRTLDLNMGVAFSHLRDVIRDIALSEAVDNSYRILNHPETVDAFINSGRMNDHKVLNLWLKDTAKGPIYNTDIINGLARIIKNNFTLSRLAFNWKTVALQATGLGQAAVTVGKKNMLKGILEYRKRPNALAQEVIAKSPFMAERQSTFQKDIYDFANQAKVTSPISSRWMKGKSAFAKLGFAPIVKVQFYVVDMPTWLAGYQAGIERFSDESKAIRYADRMVARSQDSGLMGDRNAVSRGTVSETTRQSDFIRLFTTLAGYMMTKMNRAKLSIQRGVKGAKEADSMAGSIGAVSNMATDLALLYVLEAVMMGVMYSLIADDDDDKKWAGFLMRETGSAVFGGIPFIRDGVSAFNGYGGGGVYGSVLEVPANLWAQVIQGENDKALRRSIGDVIGVATGLPSTAGMRLIEGVFNSKDVSPAEAIFGNNPLTR